MVMLLIYLFSTNNVAMPVLRQASLSPNAVKRTEQRSRANKENQSRGGRAGGEGATLESSWTRSKTVRNLIVTGATIAPATGGIPWKHSDRHTTMNGHALSEDDLSEEDLSGWHGISSAIPGMDDTCADCSMPFIVAA
jgi:hypothetical protein